MPRARLVLPALAFAATLSVAMAVVGAESDSPRATLYRSVRAFHRALFEGRADDAAAWLDAEDDPHAERREQARAWVRKAWLVQSLAVEQEGRVGRVVVSAIDPRRGQIGRVSEEWVRGNDGRWRLAASGRASGGGSGG